MTRGTQSAHIRHLRAWRPVGLDRVPGEVPFHALLLPAYPVLLLYADNVVDVAPSEVVGPLVLVMGIATVLLAILARLLRSWPRAGLVAVAVLVPFLLAGVVVDAAEATWPDDFLLRLHVLVAAGWLAVAALGIYVALKLDSRLGAATQLLNLVAVVLLVLATFPLADEIRATGSERPREAIVASSPGHADVGERGAGGRDIYHFVFDRYGSERSLALGLVVDNSEFMDWLRDRGFHVVDDARANFERTALSLSSVHDMSLHQDLAGSSHAGYDDLVGRIRSSRAASTLKELGYEYVLAGSWWGPSAYSHLADRLIEPVHVASFGSALADRSLLPSLEAMAAFITSGSVDGSERQVAATSEQQFASVRSVVGQPGPKLVFAHFLVPHDPYVFLADGTVDGRAATYETQLRYTNEQLKRTIEPLLELPPDEQPIIILQADEGPYPERYDDGRDAFDWATATDEELVTKFGVLSAFYLPGAEGETALPDGLSLVNTYPEVLRRYHGLELDSVPDRTYAMVGGDYFHLVDVTDRVNEAFDQLVPR